MRRWEKMVRYCINCGNKIPDNVNFCTKCGTKTSTTQQPQQPSQNNPASTLAMPVKNKNKLIIPIIITIIAVIVICLVLFLFVFSNPSGKFVGVWNIEYLSGAGSDYEGTWTFYEDGQMKSVNEEYSSIIWRNYTVYNDKICLSSNEYSYYHCYDYDFTEGENKLTLSANDVESVILSKI
jgi:hypothetical protein